MLQDFICYTSIKISYTWSNNIIRDFTEASDPLNTNGKSRGFPSLYNHIFVVMTIMAKSILSLLTLAMKSCLNYVLWATSRPFWRWKVQLCRKRYKMLFACHYLWGFPGKRLTQIFRRKLLVPWQVPPFQMNKTVLSNFNTNLCV